MEEERSEVQGHSSQLRSELEAALHETVSKEAKNGDLLEGFDLEVLGIKRT